ncbi:MAG: hypothetical protein ABIK15_11915 [Pseudomonadota bacterium]
MKIFFAKHNKLCSQNFLAPACIFLLLCASCAYRPAPDMDTLNRKWNGKPFSAMVEKLGSPHYETSHPDGEQQYTYRYTPRPVFDDIFRGEFMSDMSTIRIQEDLAREEHSKCLLDVFVKDGRIIHLEVEGLGCRDIRDRLGEE